MTLKTKQTLYLSRNSVVSSKTTTYLQLYNMQRCRHLTVQVSYVAVILQSVNVQVSRYKGRKILHTPGGRIGMSFAQESDRVFLVVLLWL